MSIVEISYPGRDTRVVFLIDPEAFFVKDPAVTVGPVKLEMLESIVG